MFTWAGIYIISFLILLLFVAMYVSHVINTVVGMALNSLDNLPKPSSQQMAKLTILRLKHLRILAFFTNAEMWDRAMEETAPLLKKSREVAYPKECFQG